MNNDNLNSTLRAQNFLSFDGWVLNLNTNQLTQGELSIALEQRHTNLLAYLVTSANQVLPKEQIIKVVWPNKVVNDESLAVAISQLRKVLNDDARTPRYIKTIPSVGYQFIAVVIQPETGVTAEQTNYMVPEYSGRFSFIVNTRRATRLGALFVVLALVVMAVVRLFYWQSFDLPRQPDITASMAPQTSMLEIGVPLALLKQDENEWRQAVTLFRKILERDPNNAVAYLGIAEAKIKLLGEKAVAEGNYQELVGLLNKALQLNPNLAHAHMWLAHLLVWHDLDFEGAEPHYKLSIQLNPNDDVIQSFYTHFLLVQKRFKEARNQVGAMRKINPLTYSTTNLVWIYLLEGHYVKAAEELERIASTEESDEFFHQAAQNVYYQLGDEKRVYKHMQWFFNHAGFSQPKIDLLDQQFDNGGLTKVYAWLLDQREVADVGQFTPPISWARYAVASGQKTLALHYLEQAFEVKNIHTECAKADPLYFPLYDEQRFKDLINASSKF